MNTLTLNDLLKFTPKPIPVEVPEWDRTAWVRRLNARDRLVFEGWHSSETPPKDINLRVAALTLSNEDGSPFFATWEKGVEALGNQDSGAVTRLAVAGYEANDLREAKKKSGETDISKS